MIVYVKKSGDSIPVDCKDQEAVDELVRIHGEDAVIRPADPAFAVEAEKPMPEEPAAELPTEPTTDKPPTFDTAAAEPEAL